MPQGDGGNSKRERDLNQVRRFIEGLTGYFDCKVYHKGCEDMEYHRPCLVSLSRPVPPLPFAYGERL